MDGYFLGALAFVAAPILSGQVSLSRGLWVIFIVGIALITLSWAYGSIANTIASRNYGTQAPSEAEFVLYCGSESHNASSVEFASHSDEYDNFASNYILLSERLQSGKETNAIFAVATVDPTTVSCAANGLT